MSSLSRQNLLNLRPTGLRRYAAAVLSASLRRSISGIHSVKAASRVVLQVFLAKFPRTRRWQVTGHNYQRISPGEIKR
jgi:hypothetical protein